MTNPQRIMLFSLFNRACQAANITGSIARDQYREQLTIKACGDLVSWSALSQEQIDDIKGDLLAIVRPADLDAQLAQIRMRATRLIYGLRKSNPAYVNELCLTKFGHADLDRLDLEQLKDLRVTLTQRRRSKVKREAGLFQFMHGEKF